jgi:LPXTG-motif cell wall-anchored protein
MTLNETNNEWLNFDGDYTDFDGDVEDYNDMEDSDNFLGLSKRGKERRQKKRELREQGYSRKEARQMALQMVPRSKKKYLALKAKQDEAPEEITNLQEQGIISNDPDTASQEILDAMNKNIADGTQAGGNTGGMKLGGQSGNNNMMYVGIGLVAIGLAYFFFIRKKPTRPSRA